MSTILVTGAAGFIASKTADLLLQQGNKVIGIDNLNDYYDVKLKHYRLDKLKQHQKFSFYHIDIEQHNDLEKIFLQYKFDAVINLAARAGVRYSIQNPYVYVNTNEIGTLNLLELMRKNNVKKMVIASSSSLYAGQNMPFTENLPVNTPISPYAASKKAAEMMCYTYHYLYGLDITILRYFTVYGPAGRPDMSIFRFCKWIDDIGFLCQGVLWVSWLICFSSCRPPLLPRPSPPDTNTQKQSQSAWHFPMPARHSPGLRVVGFSGSYNFF